MFDKIIGTQPFDDGFIVERKLTGSSRWCDYLMIRYEDRAERVLRLSLNERGEEKRTSEQYDIASKMAAGLLGGCEKIKMQTEDDKSFCLVEMNRNIAGKDMPTAAVVRMAADICEALAVLQENEYIHRNIKPINISFFNGAYFLNSFDLMEKLTDCDDEYVMGTPMYMAPEAMNGICSLNTDLYALGLTMYCMLNKNRLPFDDGIKSSNQIMELRLKGNEIPALPHINPELMSVIRKACAFNTTDRYQNAEEMLDTLQKYNLEHGRKIKTEAEYIKESLLEIPEFSEKWEINSVLGSGSYGVVFDVTDRITLNRYAMKVVPISTDTFDNDQKLSMTNEQIQRYCENQFSKASQEALVWNSISSCRNVVRLYDSGKINDPESEYGCFFYMCSELLSPIENDIRDEHAVAQIAADICAALNVIHNSNITHRDIKPENIMFSPSEGYKLGDFGIAKLHRFKANATVIGTVSYMPPEILKNYYDDLRSSEYDNSVDIYSLGLTMYTLLNKNRGPFINCPEDEITNTDIRNDNICRAKGMEFPKAEFASERLMRVIRKACAFEPSERYANAADMREALLDFLDD